MYHSRLEKHCICAADSVKRYNEDCKEMYQRLSERKKSERVIKIVLRNKNIKTYQKRQTGYIKITLKMAAFNIPPIADGEVGKQALENYLQQ